MQVEFLVEEPSAEVFLRGILPKLFLGRPTIDIHTFQGKRDLLNNLPSRLLGYKRWLPSDWRIVVLVDEDRQDCQALKHEMEDAARFASLVTKTAAGPMSRFSVLNRIAVEELEAWYFGDAPALAAAFPGVPLSLSRKSKYRDPDAIKGGTWEALEKVLKHAGYYPSGLAKIDAARRIAERFDPSRNKSHSFQVFRAGLDLL